jgi:hypothetical protein
MDKEKMEKLEKIRSEAKNRAGSDLSENAKIKEKIIIFFMDHHVIIFFVSVLLIVLWMSILKR